MAKSIKSIRDRFWDKVNLFHGITDEDCWEWMAGKDWDGYGMFKYNGKQHRANRFVLQYFKGLDIKDKLVLHKCDCPSCVNPSHLFIGTANDNNVDMVSKGRAKITGSINGNAKLDEEFVKQIRELISEGKYTNYVLADLFNVNYRTISTIRCGKFWKHVQ